MKRLKTFFKTTLIGGITVVLPILLSFVVFRWLFNALTGLIEPLTKLILPTMTLPKNVVSLIAFTLMVVICFILGLVVKTRIGHFFLTQTEKRILKIAPGYNLFKETIKQFLGKKKKPFSRVALVKPFGNDTLLTGFVTDEHEKGIYTVFIPSALNPTTGLICHMSKKNVHFIDVKGEDAMRTIISCGAGARELVDQFLAAGPSTSPKPV